MRILVLRGGALGDLIVTLPALRALRTRWPESEIVLIGNRRAAEVARIDGSIDLTLDQHEARWAPLFDSAPLDAGLRHWLETFDLIVNYWPDPEGEVARHFSSWGERFIAGTATVSERPAARHFLAPLARLGCAGAELAPVLSFSEAASREANGYLAGVNDVVAIHAGSGSERKTWPLDRWHTVAGQLRRPVLWITGEADGHRPPPADLAVIRAHEWPLTRLGAALARCVYYLGHDTGVSHLAAAAGARGLLLFGPTDPEIWAPPTPRMQVLRGDGGRLETVAVETVLAEAKMAMNRRTP